VKAANWAFQLCCVIGAITALCACEIYSKIRSPMDLNNRYGLTATVELVAGGTVGTADGTGGAAQFNFPCGICSDGTNLYIADSHNNSIRKLVISTGVVTTFAGSTAGSAGYLNAAGTAARFDSPWDVCTDGTSLYVADEHNNSIRQVSLSTGDVTTLAGSAMGTPGCVDATGPAARFSSPTGICWDGTNLYVADTGNSNIRRISTAGVVTTFAGDPTGTSGGSIDGIGVAARFSSPSGICSLGWGLVVCQAMYGTRLVKIADASVTTLDASLVMSAASYEGGPFLYGANYSDIKKIEISSTSTAWPHITGGIPGTEFTFEDVCCVGNDVYLTDGNTDAVFKLVSFELIVSRSIVGSALH
jgi:hypothetical protein